MISMSTTTPSTPSEINAAVLLKYYCTVASADVPAHIRSHPDWPGNHANPMAQEYALFARIRDTLVTQDPR